MKSSSMPKDLSDCVNVLQEVSLNLTKCVDNLNASRANTYASKTKSNVNAESVNTKNINNMYRTMMSPKEWDEIRRRNQNLHIQMKNLPNNLTSTKPQLSKFDDDNDVDDYECFDPLSSTKNSLKAVKRTRSATMIQNSFPNSYSPNNNQTNQKCAVYQNNRTLNNTATPYTKQVCCRIKPSYNASCTAPNIITPYSDQSARYLQNSWYTCKSLQESEDNFKDPFVELEELIMEIDDILKKTRSCTESRKQQLHPLPGMDFSIAKCKQNPISTPKLCENESNVSQGMSSLICKLDKFISNQKNQIIQFENMVEKIKNEELTKKDQSTESVNEWTIRLNDIIDTIIDGFGNVIKTLTKMNEKPDKDLIKKEDKCSGVKRNIMEIRIKELQNDLIDNFQCIIGNLKNCLDVDEVDKSNGTETKIKSSDTSLGLASNTDSKVEVEIEQKVFVKPET